MNKAIITVVGQDTVGIIARVCTYLSAHKVNVLDISQTIIDGFFNMMMIVDYSNADEEFGTVVGQDTVGIIARVCTYLSAHQVNVLDISQTIIDGFFNMMMIVDYSNADEEFGTVVDDLDKLGEEIGVRIRCQREEIFTKMHRV